ncbi:GntR family transcriptional regulator [Ignatzschineria ureiclastica]|uniref:HTH-type transcriptional regulator NorG n=1 Tax=Ignatzschineria ureiclastica TaxID=472582 RepID=A0A2U2AG82_9GAMM|nr:PLP-dependent aminotransferase family protein [Ignatzschineria ureiclastica]PWD81627.1 GntR family transcriptional regulator [Ignatzschineria ureiclastica]GGZ89410.1 hypothetical protein GCM10007162_00020 [Ignatzschineria ureiclastica]
MTRYENIANEISQLIQSGILQPAEKIPSIRKASKMFDASPATIQQAYYLLETQGIIYAKERSGFYVTPIFNEMKAMTQPIAVDPLTGQEVEMSEFIFSVLNAHKDQTNVPFGSAFPSPELFPINHLAVSMAKGLNNLASTPYELVTDMNGGCNELKRQIEFRYFLNGLKINASEIVITSGAMEALSLSLQAITNPGDIVAIESPCFYAILQILERLQLRAVEIPVDPEWGMRIEELESAIEQFDLKAIVLMTKFQNPVGSTMPKSRLKALYQLIKKYQIPAVVDDVYSEIYYGTALPDYLKSFDEEGLILHCDSFCKSLAPGFRVGWVAAGRYATKIERLKLMTTISPSVPSQLAITHYLKHRHYDRHLAKLRVEFQKSQQRMIAAIHRYFPTQVEIVMVPKGGYFLWLKLPANILALALYDEALTHHISIAPGPIFSASQQYQHYIRLNYGMKWNDRLDRAMQTLGGLIQLLGEKSVA